MENVYTVKDVRSMTSALVWRVSCTIYLNLRDKDNERLPLLLQSETDNIIRLNGLPTINIGTCVSPTLFVHNTSPCIFSSPKLTLHGRPENQNTTTIIIPRL